MNNTKSILFDEIIFSCTKLNQRVSYINLWFIIKKCNILCSLVTIFSKIKLN